MSAPGVDPWAVAGPADQQSGPWLPSEDQAAEAIQNIAPGATITSQQRTPEHNAAVNGVPNSMHIGGHAADIVLPPGVSPEQFRQQLQDQGYPVTEFLVEHKGDQHSTGDHVHWGWAPKGDAQMPANDPWAPAGQAAPDPWAVAGPNPSQSVGNSPQSGPQKTAKPEESWAGILTKNIANFIPSMKQAVLGLAEWAVNTGPPSASDVNPAFSPSEDTTSPLQKQAQTAAAKAVKPWFDKAQADVAADIKENSPQLNEGSAKYYASTVLGGAVQMAPALAAGLLTRNPVVGATIMAAQAGGQKYSESLAAGRTPQQASMDAGFDAVLNGTMGALDVGVLMKPGGTFLKQTLKSAGAIGLQSVMTEALQIGYDYGLVSPNMTLHDAGQRLMDAGIVGTLTGGLLSAGHQGLTRAAAAWRSRNAPPPKVEPTAASPVQPAPTPSDLAAKIGITQHGQPPAVDPWAPADVSRETTPLVPQPGAPEGYRPPTPEAEALAREFPIVRPQNVPRETPAPARIDLRGEHELEVAQNIGTAQDAADRAVPPARQAAPGLPNDITPEQLAGLPEDMTEKQRAALVPGSEGEFTVGQLAAKAPEPPEVAELRNAQSAVDFARSPPTKEKSLLATIKAMGGIKLKDAEGNDLPDAPEVRAVLKDVRLPGLINNKAGRTPDYLRESLTESGWMNNGNRDVGQTDLNDLYGLLGQEAQGAKVYHPESAIHQELASRAMLDREFAAAGIGASDSRDVAAQKLTDFRRGGGADSLADEQERAIDNELGQGMTLDEFERLHSDNGYEPGADIGEEHEAPAGAPAHDFRPEDFGFGEGGADERGGQARAGGALPQLTPSEELKPVLADHYSFNGKVQRSGFQFEPSGESGSHQPLATELDSYLKRSGVDRTAPMEVLPVLANYVGDRGLWTGNESFVTYDAGDASTLAATTNQPRAVAFGKATVDRLSREPRQVVSFHNHPSSNPFSRQDVNSLGMPGHAAMVVTAHDGNWFGVRLRAGVIAENPDDVVTLLEWLQRAAEAPVRFAMNPHVEGANTFFGEAANRALYHGVQSALARAGITDYLTSWEHPDEQARKILEFGIDQAARDIRERTGVLRPVTDVHRPAGTVQFKEGLARLLAGAGIDAGQRANAQRARASARLSYRTPEQLRLLEEERKYRDEPGAVDADGNPLPQTIIPGAEKSAVQLAKGREALGKGLKTTKAAQRDAGPLFGGSGKASKDQGSLFERAPTFFSALTRAIGDTKMSRAPAKDWLGMIENLKNKGVKQDEIDWSGVKDWLQSKTGPVTRDEVLEHLRENEVEVRETKLGALSRDDVRPDAQAERQYGAQWQKLVDQVRKIDEGVEQARRNGAPDTIRETLQHSRDRIQDQMDELHDQMVDDTYDRMTEITPEETQALLGALNQKVREGVTDQDAVQKFYDEIRAGDSQAIGDAEAVGVPDSIISPFRDRGRKPSKFGQYVLPGGENYRELLMTLPPKARPVYRGRSVAEVDADMDRILAEMARREPDETPGIWERHPDLAANYAALRQERNRAADVRDNHNPEAFNASHWDQPNVLAHARFDDRTGPNGEKILHIAEIQSDWHQKGRKSGYRPSGTELNKMADALEAAGDHLARVRDAAILKATGDRFVDKRSALDAGDKEAFQKAQAIEDSPEVTSALENFQNLRSRYREASGGVPQAPFKSSWHELAMKRLLRYAAEHGYDKLSWDTGETAADRFDLSKKIRKVAYVDGHLTAWDHDGEAVFSKANVKPDDLADHIGKDVAQKLLAQEPRNVQRPARLSRSDLAVKEREHDFRVTAPDGRSVDVGKGTVGPDPEEARIYAERHLNNVADIAEREKSRNGVRNGSTRSLEGLDLKVGGAGMKGFYDRILPQFVDKYTKKWGGKVRDGNIPVDQTEVRPPEATVREYHDISEKVWERMPQKERDVLTREYQRDPENNRSTPVHELDITPAMRESVMKGQPLFERRAGAPSGQPLGRRTQLAHDIVGHIPRTFTPAERHVMARVAAIAKTLVPDAEVTVARRLTDASGKRLAGAEMTDGLKRTIAWSLESPDAVGTLRHEALHWLKQSGFIGADEWSALERAAHAGNWIGKYDINGRYPDLDAEGKIEEAVADAFKNWRRGPARVPMSVRPVFEKIAALLGHIADYLRRAFGHDATANDVFSRMATGEIAARNPAGMQGASGSRFEVPNEPAKETLDQKIRNAGEKLMGLWHDFQMKTVPMALGSKETRADAKDFANLQRLAADHGQLMDKRLKSGFDPAQRRKMWDAADAESVAAQNMEASPPNGLSSLDGAERNAVLEQQADGEEAWRAAKDAGIVSGNGLPSYVPRMMVEIAGTGAKPLSGEGAARSIPGIGRNLRTTTKNLLHRKHMTAEETEAAARVATDKNALLVRDIRTLPLAVARLRQATAGRQLINRIKEIGARMGQESVVEGHDPSRADDNWFHLNHPAFFTWRPKFEKSAETGEWVVQKDSHGQPVLEKTPLWVHGDYEGPLRAVLSQDTGAVYRAAMDLKGRAMSSIMFSPLVQLHLLTEIGRAFPTYPLKIVSTKLFFEGNAAKHDPNIRAEAIMHGMVPISHQGQTQDISSIAQGDNIVPGRSILSKVLAAVPNLFDKGAGDAVKRTVDRMGDVLHNTLLWDRVQDLQFGLYTNFRDDLVRKGFAPDTAQYMAAHFANRYAGTLPQEAMSSMARKTANLLLFSRTYTLGNWGVAKDIATGLPRDVQAQIERALGPEELKKAVSYSMRKTAAVLAIDVALAYVGYSLLKNAFDYWNGVQDLNQIEQGYVNRLKALGTLAITHPLDVLNPFADLDKLSSTAENEIDPETGQPLFRIPVGKDKRGTEIYARNPLGKFAEEYRNWFESPATTGVSKLSPYAKPTYDMLRNNQGWGGPNNRIWQRDDPSYVVALKIARHYMEAFVPMDQLEAAHDLLTNPDKGPAMTRMGLRTLGITERHGAIGGPKVGELQYLRQEYDAKVQAAMPGIMDKLHGGDRQGAVTDMKTLHMPNGLIRYYLRTANNPRAKLTTRTNRMLQRTASPEEKERLRQMEGQ